MSIKGVSICILLYVFLRWFHPLPHPVYKITPEAMSSRPDSRALLASTAILTSAMQRYV